MSAAREPSSAFPLLLDTHVLLWLIEGYGALGVVSRAAIGLATKANSTLISAITPWEIALLVSKKRLTLDRDVLKWVRETLAMPGVSLAPLEPEIAVESTCLPFEIHPDPADRILVATARRLSATLVTADRLLLDLAAAGHFHAMDAQL